MVHSHLPFDGSVSLSLTLSNGTLIPLTFTLISTIKWYTHPTQTQTQTQAQPQAQAQAQAQAQPH